MARTLQIAALSTLLFSYTGLAVADDYAAARAELIAAYQAKDFAAMVIAAQHALMERPGYPAARFNLALAHALNGDAGASLRVLESLLVSGIDFNVAELEEFAEVRSLAGWPAYEQGIRALRQPVGNATVAEQRDDDRFVPEGIAIDADGRILLGSIRRGTIVRGDEVLSRRQGHWSVFGMRFHNDGSLWFASAAVPQLADVGADQGKTGLFRLDMESGKITRAALLPQRVDEQVLGDLVLAGDTIYTTDSLTGALYRYDIAADEFTALLEPGTFGSPQGLVLDESGKHLYVADYIGGLYRVAVGDGEFRLSPEGTSIVEARVLAANLPGFDEPTLGAIRDDVFYFVANSHWNRFDRDNALPDGLAGPIVLKVSLAE
jgi:sugar lactone lactonase YvrE